MRKVLQKFGADQEKKLDVRNDRGDWQKHSLAQLAGMLFEEVFELNNELVRFYGTRKPTPGERRRIAGECVDVANVAMFIADNIHYKTSDRGRK